MSPLTLEQMRADIAEVLQEPADAIVAGENLLDLGLDSLRIMALAARWSRPDTPVEFADLAELTELASWWAVVSRRQAGAAT